MEKKEMGKIEMKNVKEEKRKEEERKRREKEKERKKKEKEKEKEKERKRREKEKERKKKEKERKNLRKKVGKLISKTVIKIESPQQQVRKLIDVKKHYFEKVMEEEREGVMMFLICKFRRLSYYDLEEVYSDGCLVLWNKMIDDNYQLKEDSLDSFLKKICWNIGMHYLRKVKDEEVSYDELVERNDRKYEVRYALEDVIEVIEDKMRIEEKYEMLKKLWDGISDVDRMILESFYLDGCMMNEIAKRIGYKNGDSVKSRKIKVLRMMKKRMSEMMVAS